MKVIASGRQTGRTTKLIEMAAEAEANGEVCYIVVHNSLEAGRVARLARAKGLTIGFPLTYDEFINGRIGTNIHHFYIDNVELLIRYISRVPIEAITITTEEEG